MSEERTIREWQELFDAKQTIRKFRNALAGNGGGTVDVAGEPGYIWCRYSADQSKVSKVFNIIAPGLPEDFPIVVGRRFPTDEFEQVLAVNWTLYQDIITQDTVDNFTTGNHGESHNAADGADPAPIDLRNIVEMRGRAQATANLTIDVERGQYVFGYNDVRRFPGEMIDLTASVPGVAGHRFVLVYVDGVTNTLGSTVGAIVPLANAAPIPDITANTIPVCLVDLENAQTTITEDDIYDWRFLWDLVSWNAPWLIGTNAERLALVVADLAELTHFAETDTDQVWQVWEGAWRIVYPPSVLAASDGDPGTPWIVGATGILTGSQNLVLDDGVTDSPQLLLVGGSNDDTAKIFLDNSGIAGQSDLAITLPGNDANSILRINDSGVAQKFAIDAEGSLFQYVNDAITNTFSVWQTLEHNSTGAPLAGFAGRVLYRLEPNGGAMTDAAAMQVGWLDPTAGSEDSVIRFYLRKAGAVLGEFLRIGSTETVFNDGGADVDLRIEGDSTSYLFFVDAGNDRIGIGTSSPDSILDLSVGAGANVAISLNDADMTANAYGTLFNPPVSSTTIGRISNWSIGGFVMSGFGGSDAEPGMAVVGYTYDTTPATAANVITAWKPNGPNARQALSGTEKVLEIWTGTTALVTVQANGNVGIGITAPTAKLHVDQASTTAAIPVLTLDQADVSEEMIEFVSTIGVGNAIEAKGGKTLTTTHFIKISIPGGLTRYIPVGTIA